MNDILTDKMDATPPKPRWRMWRTFFCRPRDLRQFINPISFEEVSQPLPTTDEAAHWGEVLLLEDHISVLHRDGTVTYGVHYIGMLHGDMNLAQWEQVAWYYQTKFWRPTVHHASLRLPDGWTQQAARFDRLVDAPNKTRLMQVTFGPLRRGAIAEFRHQSDYFQPYPVGPCMWGQFFLHTGPPCRRRRFTIAVAAPFTAEVQSHHGAEQPVESQVNEYRVYQWDSKNVPGIEWDAWTPPLRDFGPWIDFTTLPSWTATADQYRKEIKPTMTYEVQSLARKLTEKAKTDREKITEIYRYAAEQVRYGRPPHELYLPASRPASQMFEDLRGDCKDKSTLIIAMLRAIGMDAELALVVTRSKGLAPFLPAPRFDHAVVVAPLDGKMVWLDAAAGPLTFGEMAFQDQGVRALIIADDDCDYIESPQPKPEDHGVTWLCRGKLEPDGRYDFQLTFTATGERASGLRLALLHRNQDHRDRVLRQTLMRGVPGAEVLDLKPTGIDDLTGALQCECRVSLAGCARPHDSLMLLHVPWAEPAIYDGPLATHDRPQPLAPPLMQTIHERHEIELPVGWSLAGSPMEKSLACPWGSHESSARIEDGRLVCERRTAFLGGIVPPERYLEFRDFWAACARADADAVVLRRG